ncbi:MAG: hypothetical protein GXP42_18400 [Chloroflexi bacterium]|nr:hypothetical protein [Chloroflexota bacterium]
MSISAPIAPDPILVADSPPRELEERYSFRNASAVSAYLSRHPTLTDLLSDSYEHLRDIFGSEPEFVLEVVRDPEALHPEDYLFVNIRTSMPVDEAIERLDRFDEIWYLDQIEKFGNLINFSLELYEL